MHLTRKATCELISKATDGALSWEQIARAALDYMSEDEVSDMAIGADLIDEPDEDSEDDTTPGDVDGVLFLDEMNNFMLAVDK